MNRLQKKCILATAGIHLLLLVILLVGPAFFEPRPKPDDLQVLDVIPANLIDAQFTSGVRNAQPPAPTPVVTPLPPQPQPTPPAPQPVVTPPTLAERLEKMFKSEPPKPAPEKIQPHKIQPDLKPVVHHASQNVPDDAAKRARALRKAIQSLKSNLSSSTTVDMPGNSSVAYASYRDVIGSIYYAAWTPPDDTSNDDAHIKVRIVIASDGTVVSAQVITPSGDAKVDDTVQRALERVTFIAPFPEGMTEKEKPFNIDFSLKTKRMLE